LGNQTQLSQRLGDTELHTNIILTDHGILSTNGDQQSVGCSTFTPTAVLPPPTVLIFVCIEWYEKRATRFWTEWC